MAPHLTRRLFRLRFVLVWVLGSVAAVYFLVGGWIVPNTYAGAVRTAKHLPGSCQRFAIVEKYYTLSDVSPSVSCHQPHQTEVYYAGRYTGPFSSEKIWPGVDAMTGVQHTLCENQNHVLAYLRARPRDTVWGLQEVVRLPTPVEWNAGDRTYRCELMPVPESDGQPPELVQPLAGVLQKADATRWRRCADGPRVVTCDHEHTAEFVNVWLPVGPKVDLAVWAKKMCPGYVNEYLGAKAASRGVGVGALEVPGKAVRMAACVALPPHRMAGSLAPRVGQ